MTLRNSRFAALAAIGAAALFIAACDSDDSICEENGISTTIADNHPNGSHELTIPLDDVAAAVEVVYDIQGNNTGHAHTVTVTASDFEALDSGTVVTITSSDTGAVGMDHTHEVTISCI